MLKTKKLIIFICLAVLLISPLCAQEYEEELILEQEQEEESSFFIDRSTEHIRFIQRLTWEPAEYALRYEVVIERLEAGRYMENERVTVSEPAAEVSLTAGLYRYRIDVYDLLGELSFESEWLEFEIKRAVQPHISSFSPNAFYLDEDNDWILTLRGQNLIPESEIWLIPRTAGTRGSSRVIPRRKTFEGSTARLEFLGASLTLGEYSIYIRNPGGLDYTAAGSFTVTNRKPFDLNFTLGYAPIFPMHGFLFKDYRLEAPFTAGIYPLGALIRANFIPYKLSWGSLGAEASFSYTHLEGKKDYYSASSPFLNVHLSFLYQIHFFNRLFAFNANIGIGLSSLPGFQYKYPIGSPADKVTAHYPSFIGGLSLVYHFKRPFFAHAGVDFIQFLSAGESVPKPGFFRPFVAAGYKW